MYTHEFVRMTNDYFSSEKELKNASLHNRRSLQLFMQIVDLLHKINLNNFEITF